MFTPDQLITVSKQLAMFFQTIDSIDGLAINCMTFEMPVHSKNYPDLRAIKWAPEGFILMFEDYEHHFAGRPSVAILMDALNRWSKVHKENELVQSIINTLADEGFIYVPAIDPDTMDKFMKAWSDAYGEDHPECYMKKHPNGYELTGFIRTNLPLDQIAAKKNEDGDDDYRPAPMFPNVKKEA